MTMKTITYNKENELMKRVLVVVSTCSDLIHSHIYVCGFFCSRFEPSPVLQTSFKDLI
jgi:hypothetical protein